MRQFAIFLLLLITIAVVSAQTSQQSQSPQSSQTPQTSSKLDSCLTTSKTAFDNLCQANDKDCLSAQDSVKLCLIECTKDTVQNDAYVLYCAQTYCPSNNKTVDAWLNNFLSCLHLTNLSFSMLLLAIFAFALL
ncbi:hypothetical protein ABPG74_010340 [Tetrahymena malaccensis]